MGQIPWVGQGYGLMQVPTQHGGKLRRVTCLRGRGGCAREFRGAEKGKTSKFHCLTGENQLNRAKGREMGQRRVCPDHTGWLVQKTGLLSEDTSTLFRGEKAWAGRWKGRRRGRLRIQYLFQEKKKV